MPSTFLTRSAASSNSEGDTAGMWNQLELHVSVSTGSIDSHFLIDVTLIGVFPKPRPLTLPLFPPSARTAGADLLISTGRQCWPSAHSHLVQSTEAHIVVIIGVLTKFGNHLGLYFFYLGV